MWKIYLGGFPGPSGIKKAPAKAEDTGMGPWSGKIPRATEQLSPHTLEIVFHNKRSDSKEKPSNHNERVGSPRSLQLGKACLQQQRPSTAENKTVESEKIKIIFKQRVALKVPPSATGHGSNVFFTQFPDLSVASHIQIIPRVPW